MEQPKPLRERLWGKIKPLAERLADVVAPASVVTYDREKDGPKQNLQTMPILGSTKTPPPADPVKVEDGALVPSKSPRPTVTNAPKPTGKKFLGTNYDPFDPDQTKPEPDGIGKALIPLDDNMVATSLKEDGVTGNLRLGTVIKVPSLGNRIFLVADTMNSRFNGQNKIDFVRKDKKKEPDPEVNREFDDIEIIREGQGPEDARNLVESGEWEELLKQYTTKNS